MMLWFDVADMSRIGVQVLNLLAFTFTVKEFYFLFSCGWGDVDMEKARCGRLGLLFCLFFLQRLWSRRKEGFWSEELVWSLGLGLCEGCECRETVK